MANFRFFRRPIVIVPTIIVVAGIGVYFLFIKKSASLPEAFIAKRGTIMQEVSVTGKTKAAKSVDLAFEKIGKIAAVNVQVGDKVVRGQTLVVQANGDIAAQLEEAKASVLEQKATLEKLKKGTRPEEIQIQQVKVDNAKADLLKKIQDAYTKADDAVRNKTDQIFSNPKSSNPQLNAYLNIESSLKTDVEWRRFIIESKLNSWQFSLDDVDLTKTNLDEIKTFLEKTALVVNNATANSNLSQTTLDSWRSDISTGRTNVNAAITNLSDAESTLLVEQNNLILANAGSTPEQIAEQEAKVTQAEANVKNYEAQLAKTILSSPINGVVTRQDAKVGEIVAANTVIASVISAAKFQIEADIPEADIVKLKIGAPAEIALPAFPRQIFAGKIIFIGEAEKIIDEVIYYEVKIAFDKDPPEGIKPSMTADVIIQAEAKEDALIIPREAVRRVRGKMVVEVAANDLIWEREVETGLRSDTMIEILSGLSEGEKVIIR